MRGISIQKFSNRDGQESKRISELLSNALKLAVDSLFRKHDKIFPSWTLKYTEKTNCIGEITSTRRISSDDKSCCGDMRILFDTTSPYLVAKEMQSGWMDTRRLIDKSFIPCSSSEFRRRVLKILRSETATTISTRPHQSAPSPKRLSLYAVCFAWRVDLRITSGILRCLATKAKRHSEWKWKSRAMAHFFLYIIWPIEARGCAHFKRRDRQTSSRQQQIVWK